MRVRSYSEIARLPTFIERFRYLKLEGEVGLSTFGFDRYLNQALYHSHEWKSTRDKLIIRDEGCDLGIPGYEIYDKIIVHHMNPITEEDIIHRNPEVMDPEFLICVSLMTHNALHYGDESLIPREPVIRRPNDTTPWK